jgi:hypothetical protein
MTKITIKNSDYHLYADKRAKTAFKKYACEPKDLLSPLTDLEFRSPDDQKHIAVEVKINNSVEGSFLIQPALIESQKWFIMSFTNITEPPIDINSKKYKLKLACGHSVIGDKSVDNKYINLYHDCQICKREKTNPPGQN